MEMGEPGKGQNLPHFTSKKAKLNSTDFMAPDFSKRRDIKCTQQKNKKEKKISYTCVFQNLNLEFS